MTALVEPQDAGDRSKPFPWRSTFNPQLHFGEFYMSEARMFVRLGIAHRNYIVQATANSWRNSNAVKLAVSKVADAPGTFEIAALKADNSEMTLSGAVMTGGTGPFNITPGQDTSILLNGVLQGHAWSAERAILFSSGATYASLDGKSFSVSVNGGPPGTVTFGPGDVDRASVLATITAAAISGLVVVTSGGNELSYSSSQFGTGSSLQFTAFDPGVAAALGLPPSTVTVYSGSGDAPNIAAVTAAQAAAALAGTFTGVTVTVEAGALTITANAPTDTLQLDGASLATLGFDGALHVGTDGVDVSFVVQEKAPV